MTGTAWPPIRTAPRTPALTRHRQADQGWPAHLEALLQAPGNGAWRKHVRWCSSQHADCDPDTNTFWTVHGRRYCDSPFT